MVLCILDGDHSAAENMARNEACFEAVKEDKYSRIVRIYGFSKPAAILAKNQDHWDVRENAGIEVTRRPTGGCVVYVDESTLAYSVFTKQRGIAIPKAYNDVTEKILTVLREQGLSNVMVEGGYMRFEGQAIGGHSQIVDPNTGTTEVHGILQLERWQREILDRTLRLRTLATRNGDSYLIIDNVPYTVNSKLGGIGTKANINIAELSISRHELDELVAMPSLRAYGITKETLGLHLANRLSAGREPTPFPEDLENSVDNFLGKYHDPEWLKRGSWRGLGHCFINLVKKD